MRVHDKAPARSLIQRKRFAAVSRASDTVSLIVDGFGDESHRSIDHREVGPARMPTAKALLLRPKGKNERGRILRQEIVDRNIATAPITIAVICRRVIVEIRQILTN